MRGDGWISSNPSRIHVLLKVLHKGAMYDRIHGAEKLLAKHFAQRLLAVECSEMLGEGGGSDKPLRTSPTETLTCQSLNCSAYSLMFAHWLSFGCGY